MVEVWGSLQLLKGFRDGSEIGFSGDVSVLRAQRRLVRSYRKRFDRRKGHLVNGLIAAGIRKIDCVAFTHPRLIPDSADAERVVELIEKEPGVAPIGVAPSEVACRRAVLSDTPEPLSLK